MSYGTPSAQPVWERKLKADASIEKSNPALFIIQLPPYKFFTKPFFCEKCILYLYGFVITWICRTKFSLVFRVKSLRKLCNFQKFKMTTMVWVQFLIHKTNMIINQNHMLICDKNIRIWYRYSSNIGFSEKCVGHLMFFKWRQNARWPSFVQEEEISWYNFWQTRSRFMILASTTGFSGMSDILVWPESRLYYI